MSDLSIPGVSNKYNTSEMIKAIMDVEKIPLNRLEKQKEEYESQRKVWQQVNRTIDTFRDSAKSLYSFQNPFQNLVATSNNDASLTATASRQADEENYSLEVVRAATGDKFATPSLNEDFRVKAGNYSYKIGDEEVSIDFRGGTLDDFAKAVNRRGTGLLSASVIRDTFDTKVLVLTGMKTGNDNRLFFNDAARELGIELGMLREEKDTSFSLTPNKLVEPGNKESISIGTSLAGSETMKINYSVENLSRDAYQEPAPPPGPSLESPEGISLEGISIQNEASSVELPSWTPPPPPPFSESKQIFSIGKQRLKAISGEEGSFTLEIDSQTTGGVIEALQVDNSDNTHRRVTINTISVTDPASRGDVSPARPISTAGNAVLKLDGIEIERSSNEIDDIVPGLTFHVKAPSTGPVDISVSPDKEEIKNSLIQFVGSYNQLMTRLNILTSNNANVVDEIEYFTDDEREEAMEQLGLFQGDSTFIQLKSRLQRIISAPYETSEENRLSMLSQIGISTNSTGLGGGLDARRLRGYLEINEAKLDESLDSGIVPAIKELFGRDSNGDLTVDSGLGYDADQYTSYFTRTGGLIANRISGINRRIETAENNIESMETDLERKEQQLKIKYGRMESALNTMEENSKALDNLNNNSNQ
jgi:flagellar hook-associated protein 2